MIKRLFKQKKLLTSLVLMCLLVPCFIGASITGALVSTKGIKDIGSAPSSVSANVDIAALKLTIDTERIFSGTVSTIKTGKENYHKPGAKNEGEYKDSKNGEAIIHTYNPAGLSFTHKQMFDLLNSVTGDSKERINRILATFSSTIGNNTTGAQMYKGGMPTAGAQKAINTLARYNAWRLGQPQQGILPIATRTNEVILPEVSQDEIDEVGRIVSAYEQGKINVDMQLFTAIIEVLSRCSGCQQGPPIVLCGGDKCLVSERNMVLIPLIIEALTTDDELEDVEKLADDMFEYMIKNHEEMKNVETEEDLEKTQSGGTGQNPGSGSGGGGNGFLEQLMNMMNQQNAGGAGGPGGFNIGDTSGMKNNFQVRTDLAAEATKLLEEFISLVEGANEFKGIPDFPEYGAKASQSGKTITYEYNHNKDWYPSICGDPAPGSKPGGNEQYKHKCVPGTEEEGILKDLKELAKTWDTSEPGYPTEEQYKKIEAIIKPGDKEGVACNDYKKCRTAYKFTDKDGKDTEIKKETEKHCLVWHILECVNDPLPLEKYKDSQQERRDHDEINKDNAKKACQDNAKRQPLFEGKEKQWPCCQAHGSENVAGWTGKEEGKITITLDYETTEKGVNRVKKIEKKSEGASNGNVIFKDKLSDQYANTEEKEGPGKWWDYVAVTRNEAQLSLVYQDITLGMIAPSHKPGENNPGTARDRMIHDIIGNGQIRDGEVWYFSHGWSGGVQAYDPTTGGMVNFGVNAVMNGAFGNFMMSVHGIDLRNPGYNSMVISTCGSGGNNTFAQAILRAYPNIQRVYANNQSASMTSTMKGSTGHTYFPNGSRVNGRHPIGCRCGRC